ncbi:hypothetical protein TNCV_2398371 [Trichonephila clavipes]|uniref:Uncharacterized protein n=1 Tax=Trichonephila clavipes TaxID=2585209 RepID=A0A8X6T019_TRICX|nr:hypothetical protein TNCV_2398371 [Trichonephila clavipes]
MSKAGLLFESFGFPFRITLWRISELDFTASERKRKKKTRNISTLKSISNRKTTKAEGEETYLASLSLKEFRILPPHSASSTPKTKTSFSTVQLL